MSTLADRGPVKLPNAEQAFVDPVKVRDYLLSREHTVGRAKARFFSALGFTRPRWPALRKALLDLGQEGETNIGIPTVFGQKYVVEGMLRAPDGRTATVVTVWIVRRNEDFPRLITAYPSEVS